MNAHHRYRELLDRLLLSEAHEVDTIRAEMRECWAEMSDAEREGFA